ncbi:RNA polymerase II transcription mediator complex subunit 9-domain-containing protein [Phyllosticta citriasiana]|uniref:RNA polymerase II transcription mediator complex subunit 9-domain-containing protein n=1 Tax=Phyllosticta citriasiana TaxID=595635 RepID=UPI0030FD2E34
MATGTVPPSLAAAAASAANTSLTTPRPSISRSAFSTPAPGTPSAAVSRSYSKAPDAATAANGSANNPNGSPAAAIPPLPSPATFDLLPQLHILLSRLLIPKPAVGGTQQQQQAAGTSGATSNTATATAAAASGNAQSQGGGAATTTTAAAAADQNKDAETQPLEIHQLAAAASALKVRLQRARQACARLGDVDRSVEEQEDEMRELEARVAKLRAVLEELGVGGAAVAAEGAVV